VVDRAIIESIVHVARSMGVRTVAEFVESPRLARMVNELGVDESQGYAISPPQRLEAVFAEVLMAQSMPTTVPSESLELMELVGV
jgi:EAL domain-containing protein (putative c-di-GMP-specific phosphodiesterase class I)